MSVTCSSAYAWIAPGHAFIPTFFGRLDRWGQADQGRDFETFMSFVANSDGVPGKVGICSLVTDRPEAKILAHAMAEADLDFVRDPTVAELATGMYAESLTTWSHPAPLEVTARPADWSALAASTDFALYEAESARQLTIHCARRRWQLVRKNGRWSMDSVSKADQTTADTLEKWLGPRYKSSVRRGFCPAVLCRVEP